MSTNRKTWGFLRKLTTQRPRLDWGDAPDGPYPTLAASAGAAHVIRPGYSMGPAVDRDANGQPHPIALGDDGDADGDDEDGVVITSPLVPGVMGTVDVTAVGGKGYLNAWADFNRNGDWGDPAEQIFTSELLNMGVNSLAFAVPAGTLPDAQGFRRLSRGGGSAGKKGCRRRACRVAVRSRTMSCESRDPPTISISATRPIGRIRRCWRMTAHGMWSRRISISARGSTTIPMASRAWTPTETTRILTATTKKACFSRPCRRLAIRSGCGWWLRQPGLLDAWADWNRDGDWDDAGEQIFANEALGGGAEFALLHGSDRGADRPRPADVRAVSVFERRGFVAQGSGRGWRGGRLRAVCFKPERRAGAGRCADAVGLGNGAWRTYRSIRQGSRARGRWPGRRPARLAGEHGYRRAGDWPDLKMSLRATVFHRDRAFSDEPERHAIRTEARGGWRTTCRSISESELTVRVREWDSCSRHGRWSNLGPG